MGGAKMGQDTPFEHANQAIPRLEECAYWPDFLHSQFLEAFLNDVCGDETTI